MDAEKFRNAYRQLQGLDERLTYRVRMRPGPNRLTVEQLEERCRDLGSYTVELKEILHGLFLAIAGSEESGTDRNP